MKRDPAAHLTGSWETSDPVWIQRKRNTHPPPLGIEPLLSRHPRRSVATAQDRDIT